MIIRTIDFETTGLATCLWLKNLPKITPTNIVEGREGRVWKTPPSPDRQRIRSETYQGIADAMAEQWGSDGRELIIWEDALLVYNGGGE